MGDSVGVKYIGKDAVYEDNILRTGLSWEKGEVHVLPTVMAKEFLKHPTVFQETAGGWPVLSTPSDGGVRLPGATPKNLITVALDGSGDYTNLKDVIAYLDKCDVPGTDLIIVTVKAGHYDQPGYLLLSQHIYFNVFINGEAINGRSLVSIASTTGSPRAYAAVLNVDDASNIEVGDWLLVSNTTGGTNPTYIAGASEVTAVDTVAKTVTILCTHPNATPASGAVTGEIVVMKTVLNFAPGKDGFHVWNGATLGQINNIMLVGTGSQGMSVQDNGRVLVGLGHLAVSGFASNIIVTQSGQITSVGQVTTANATFANIVASTGGGQIDLGLKSVCSNSAQYGIYCEDAGQARMNQNSIITGCATGAAALRGSSVTISSSAKVTGCSTVGVYSRDGSWISGTAPQFSGNTKDADRATDFGAIKLLGAYPLGATEIGTSSMETGGNWRQYIGVNSGSYKYVLSSRTGSVTTDLFRFMDNGNYHELSKEVVSTASLTTLTVAKKNTYLTGAAGASLAITMPNAGSVIDGQKMTIMSSVDRPSVTWASGGGGSFVGAPASLSAGVPVTLQYDQATAKWYMTH